MALIPLRQELALFPGPSLADGQPSWTLHDPVRNQFFRIDWLTFEILSRADMEDAQDILDSIRSDTTLQPDEDDIEAVLKFVADNQLICPQGWDASRKMSARLAAMQGSWAKWLLHNYLFFRIPLLKPDRFLSRMQSLVEPFFSSMFLKLTLAALFVGGVQVYRNWEQFHATLLDTFSWKGLVAYGFALVFVKILHELGHAFAAKRYGCRVPAMGVAFLVLWPVAYTDTNEVWKLSDKRQRLHVSSAGVATELIIAVWATLLWGFLPEGGVKSIAFVLATLTWIASLAINASPFMRFDGYFLLSDWLDMPNLHSRSFALARWALREKLFGLGDPPPEYFSRRKTLALIFFAYAVWIYRLVVFIGIAVLVYHFFIKAVGILLFIIEVGFFILLPVWREVMTWKDIWPRIRTSKRAHKTALIAAALALLFVVPWPTRLSASGLLKPEQSFPVYAPAGAQVRVLPWEEGSRVPAGAVLIELVSPELELRRQRIEAKLERFRWQASSAGLDEQLRQNYLVLQQELVAAEAEEEAINNELNRYQPHAPFAGVLQDLDPDMKPGVWVANGERLGLLVKPGKWLVEAYLNEEEVRRVQAGDGARFFADGLEGKFLPLKVVLVDQDATRVLPNGMLATSAGGSVLVREKQRQLMTEHATYRVVLETEDDPGELSHHSWRGKVVIRGNWEAPGISFMRSAIALLWREAGF